MSFTYGKDFLFGVSSAAFQIEGDDGKQGRGKSVWDVFCEKKGNIFEGQDAKVAIDHYNHYKEDVKLMAKLGVNCYRFSSSWSRIFPEGVGTLNQKGVDFYDRLIDELLENGLTPFLTLYHWDLPQALMEKGGFQNPDFPKWFFEYGEFIAKKYGDRVKNFITFNEPINAVHASYVAGVFAPACAVGETEGLKCLHHMLLGHGLVADVILKRDSKAKVGISMSTFEEYPATLTPENVEVAKRTFFKKESPTEAVDVYLDPVYLGCYPERLQKTHPAFWEYVKDSDLKTIAGKTNIIGYNNYSGQPIGLDGKETARAFSAKDNGMGAFIDPNGMYWGIKFLRERYRKPVFITENGLTCQDVLLPNKTVEDVDRVEYLKGQLAVLEKAISEGEEVGSYCVWSFWDNFEWKMGYSKRFGIVYVDYDTLERIPKRSYYFLQDYLKKTLE